MSAPRPTPYGEIFVADHESLFIRAAAAIEKASRGARATVGLTGGSTPKAFYDWVAVHRPFSQEALARLRWSVSDERCVPLEDAQSNFGTADHGMLRPLAVAPIAKLPYPVQLAPREAAAQLNRDWTNRFGPDHAFDLCFLGMGEDGHTLSLFPGSPLLSANPSETFAAVEVPGKGWRLTLTPAGLGRCSKIIVMVTGAGKAIRLREVLDSPDAIYPVQLLRAHAAKTLWLVDASAAAALQS